MKTGAIVLAAGISSQMKEFKPMMCVGKKTMIRHIVDTLKAVRADPIVVITGYKADIIRKYLADTGVRFAHNRNFAETQMFDSLLIGIRSIESECDRVIIAPTDIPLVRAATINELLRREAPVIRPVYNGQEGHPIVISREIFSQLKLYSGEMGLNGMIEEYGVSVMNIEVQDEGILIDANTREEYERMLAHEAHLSGKGSLHMEFNLQLSVEDVVMNTEIMQLLEMVEYTGSLQTASECINTSYSNSWRRIKEMERQLGVSILQSAVGGAKGGGSQLTEEGKCLLHAYQKMQNEGRKLLNWLFSEYFPDEFVRKFQKNN